MSRATELAAVVCLLGMASPAQAQREHYGLSGSLAFSRTSLAFDSAAARARAGATVRLGLRVCALCLVDVEWLTITPALAFGITDVRGMSRDEDPYAFSRLDAGVQVGARLHRRARPYVAWWFKNKRTAQIERDTLTYGEPGPARDNDWPIDFVDPSGGDAWTVGVEIPITPRGRGFDLSFTTLRGTFTENEFRRKVIPAMRLGYRGWTASLGYSGPFTGAGLFWK